MFEQLQKLYSGIKNDYSIQRYSLGWKDVLRVIEDFFKKNKQKLITTDDDFSEKNLKALRILMRQKNIEESNEDLYNTIEAFARELNLNTETMNNKYNSITEAEVTSTVNRAKEWWRSLSINEQKKYKILVLGKDFPNESVYTKSGENIVEIWKEITNGGLNESKEYGVWLKGGSIGSKSNKPSEMFKTREEAIEYAKRMNKRLTPGEKSYYGMKYVVKSVDVLEEAKNTMFYTIETRRNDKSRYKTGTIDSLINYFNYTLEKGKSWERERGNKKINTNPKNINALVDNLNKSESNAAANGYPSTRYYVADNSKNPNFEKDTKLDEGKQEKRASEYKKSKFYDKLYNADDNITEKDWEERKKNFSEKSKEKFGKDIFEEKVIKAIRLIESVTKKNVILEDGTKGEGKLPKNWKELSDEELKNLNKDLLELLDSIPRSDKEFGLINKRAQMVHRYRLEKEYMESYKQIKNKTEYWEKEDGSKYSFEELKELVDISCYSAPYRNHPDVKDAIKKLQDIGFYGKKEEQLKEKYTDKVLQKLSKYYEDNWT